MRPALGAPVDCGRAAWQATQARSRLRLTIMQRFTPVAASLLVFAACGGPAKTAEDPRAEQLEGPSTADARASQEPGEPRDASAPVPPERWTGQFDGKAIVVAEEIRIEGPTGLINHLAVRSDDALFDRLVETTEEGLRMVWTPKVEGELIRGQLDNWSLTAFRRIVAVEQPWAEEVSVTALGDAFWQDVDGQEQRADRLQWRGELE